MTYRLRRGTSAELRRVVRKEIGKAAGEMRAPDRQARAVHEARKRLKKIRATLRLVREELGGTVYRKESRALRNAAQSLSRERDFQVQLQALQKLRRHFPRRQATPVFAVSRAVILQNWKDAANHDRRRPARAKWAAELKAARRRVKQWPVGHLRRTDFGRGLKELYRRGRKAFRVAETDPTVDHLHACRK